jgi:oligopeptide/dipeptide ABC transporter ATP-binding protein
VGESGSGKTTIALSLLGLLGTAGYVESGAILYDGKEVTRLREREWRRLRGARIGILFQDARGALNPVLSVGTHLIEAIRAHQPVSRRRAREQAVRALEEAGVPEPRFYMRRFPFELSTGLCQRVSIALGICNQPQLLVADEPTSALDPSIQAQIMALLRELKERQGLTLLLISHDLPMVAGLADQISVIYCGRIVESGSAQEIIRNPAHPYAQGLMACHPDWSHHHEDRPLPVIAGTPPIPEKEFPGCAFAPRCAIAESKCTQSPPVPVNLSDGHWAACFKVTPKLA